MVFDFTIDDTISSLKKAFVLKLGLPKIPKLNNSDKETYWNITMLSLSSVLVLGSIFFVINEIIVKKY